MLEHQRSILATLGIEMWIPNANVQTRSYTTSLFRDVGDTKADVDIHFQTLESVLPIIENNTFIAESPVGHKQDILERNKSERESKKEKLIDQKQEKKIESHGLSKFENEIRPVLGIEAFSVQAFCLEHVTILVDSTLFSLEQSQLWMNIQASMLGLQHELKWPFPIAQFQDGRGVAVYLQGFIDAISQDKKVISLGKLPHFQNNDVIELQSLQDMLDQPLLKRDLWQLMQN